MRFIGQQIANHTAFPAGYKLSNTGNIKNICRDNDQCEQPSAIEVITRDLMLWKAREGYFI